MSKNTERTAGREHSTSRRTFLKVTGATASVAAGANLGVDAATADGGVDVDDLVDELTLEQKAGQLTQKAVGSFDLDGAVGDATDDTVAELFTEYGVGSLLYGGSNPPEYDPETHAAKLNELQRYNIEETEHGIPFVFGVDAVHGNVTVDGATAFPHNLGLGATRNVSLARDVASVTSASVDAVGAHWTFSPTTDLQRDPRWGRFYEGFSEDPELVGQFGKAKVEGYEGDGDTPRVAATVKHFGGYSIPHNGNDRSAGRTSMRDLRTNHLPPYERALAADPETVMVNSGTVNGVPAHASAWLLTTILRERWGFDGMVVSDWKDFQRMVTYHDYVPDLRAATKLGLRAGVDMYMHPDDTGEFVSIVVDLVESGELEEDRVDEAVARVLRFKERLGLFEDPFVDESAVDDAVGAGRDVARTAAEQSMTLLENDDALPLSGDENVLLTGPFVDGDAASHAQMGGWTLGWQGIMAEDARPWATTLREGVADAVGAGSVTVEQTGFTFQPWQNGDGYAFDNEDAVRAAAADADAVVVTIGEGPHSEGYGDRDELALPDAQQAVVAAVADAAGDDTPVVGVEYAGSPRGGARTFEHLDALLMAYQPGSAGGTAVARTLYGERVPSGRLPFTWPQRVGQVTSRYNAYPPARGNDPLYEFGRGLSYTSFEYADLAVEPGSVESADEREAVTVSVTVTNTGDRAADHVVEAYNTQSYGSVLQPNRRLLGTERVSLDPGESARVEVEAPLRTLSVVPGAIPGVAGKRVEAGDYEVSVGEKTATLTVAETAPAGEGEPIPVETDDDWSPGNSDDGNGRGPPDDKPGNGNGLLGGLLD